MLVTGDSGHLLDGHGHGDDHPSHLQRLRKGLGPSLGCWVLDPLQFLSPQHIKDYVWHVGDTGVPLVQQNRRPARA